ncbi:hypothetical protein [Sphaerothrix gracilis]|uniref:hypothetical protein n=1 Tax=Sphaerothrix gracilis TaxID=3151835 RepID=UPI0031FCCC36
MKHFSISSAIGHRIRLFIGFSLAVILGWAILLSQPSYAAPKASEITQTQNTAAADREDAYEKAAAVIDDPRGVEKEYEKNMDNYKRSHPSENGMIEEAKDLVEKVTTSQ